MKLLPGTFYSISSLSEVSRLYYILTTKVIVRMFYLNLTALLAFRLPGRIPLCCNTPAFILYTAHSSGGAAVRSNLELHSPYLI